MLSLFFVFLTLAAIFGFGMVTCLTVALMRRRQWQAAHTVLNYLDIALRLKLPIPDVMYAATVDERSLARRRLLRVANAIGGGRPVAHALGKHLPELDARSAALIAHAEHAGDLRGTVHQVLDEQRAATGRWNTQEFIVWGYALTVGLVTLFIASFCVWKVTPKFAYIFEDFDAPLPGATIFFMNLSDFALPIVAAAVSILLLLILLCFLLAFIWRRRTTDRYFDRLLNLVGWLPLIRASLRDRAMADLFAALASSARLMLPLSTAVKDAAHIIRWGGQRKSVSRCASHLESGLEFDAAAKKAGLPDFVVGALVVGRSGNLNPAAYRFLHTHYQHRFSRLVAAVRGAVVPIGMLAIGSVVALFCYAMFTPVAMLIDHAIVSVATWEMDL